MLKQENTHFVKSSTAVKTANNISSTFMYGMILRTRYKKKKKGKLEYLERHNKTREKPKTI